ncbi:MAG: SIMPL domain-containing protein, partial [Gammaproteobacteria bacterium]|nr:SIMPL domain-containing protein [Gammaproteobacteria bacterium]
MTRANHHHGLLAAVATGLLLFGADGARAADSEPRTVAVSGTAAVQAAPDRAYLNMSVVERNSSVTAAQTAAAVVTNRVLGLLEQLGVAREQINTTGAQIRPDYRWDRERERQELLGYVVERTITVELRELELLGKVIEQVSAAGVNQLAPPQLDSS